MTKVHSPAVRALHPHVVFRAFKYTIYCLLTLNVLLFFQEEYLASREMFGGVPGWNELAEAYSATIDTAAWLVLLLLFELETAVIPDEKLQGRLQWALPALRSVSYAFILLAFYGYLTRYQLVADTLPFSADDVCALAGQGFSWVQDLDQYPPLDAAACAALQGQALLQIQGSQIIGTGEALRAIRNLALIDIINAADWLLIVLLLEVEVYLQLRTLLSDRMLMTAKIVKGMLYALLLFCAVYWGLLGDFLDFWDAFLWLLAFVFIEMNIFQWHAEIEEEKEAEMEAFVHGV